MLKIKHPSFNLGIVKSCSNAKILHFTPGCFQPLYYAYTVMAPTLVLCILTIFTFLLPCDNGAKVAIGLTVFLSLYLLQLAIAENIPESNSLPLIGK